MKRLAVSLLAACTPASWAQDVTSPVVIGSRLELLVDEFLIETMTDGAHLQLHRPVILQHEISVLIQADFAAGGFAAARAVYKNIPILINIVNG